MRNKRITEEQLMQKAEASRVLQAEQARHRSTVFGSPADKTASLKLYMAAYENWRKL